MTNNFVVGGRRGIRKFGSCQRENLIKRFESIFYAYMPYALPNCIRIDSPYCVVKCNMASIHVCRGEFPDSTGVTHYWNTVSVKQLKKHNLVWLYRAIKQCICSSVKRSNSTTVQSMNDYCMSIHLFVYLVAHFLSICWSICVL